MNIEELKEGTEQARHSGEKAIGLTMAIVAVLLAIAGLLSHRTHTKEIVLQTKVNDEWGYYQAKNIRSHMYAADAKLAALMNSKELAADFLKDSDKQRKEADDIRKEAEALDKETKMLEHRASFYDASDLFLEVSIVLCSIALLAEMKRFWKLSFITTLVGVVIALWALTALQ
ncbi:MAG TPA: DUF4337 domain-containing protein [Candidatus Sulfotelmatobacter sp.]|nr:DUF4337 domain-containing protein [Candidatus Sulfotelmatobacter sp.]